MDTYSECFQCRFNVTPQDERCPNCGLLHPTEPLEKSISAAVVVTIGIVSLLLSVIYFGWGEGQVGLICFALPVGGVVAFICSWVAGFIMANVNASDDERRRAPHPQSLLSMEEVIKRRMREIQERDEKTKAVLGRAQHNAGDMWEQVRATLDATRQTLRKQHARYDAKLVEIEMVRLQNQLAPLVYADDASYGRIDNHLKSIEAAQEKAAPWKKQLSEQREVLGDAPDVEELSERLSEFEGSMNKLREEFVGRQAVLTLKGLSPLDDALAPVSRPVAALREAEVFNTQVALTDFSASFDELESEYARLQTEGDVAGRVSEIIERAEGGS